MDHNEQKLCDPSRGGCGEVLDIDEFRIKSKYLATGKVYRCYICKSCEKAQNKLGYKLKKNNVEPSEIKPTMRALATQPVEASQDQEFIHNLISENGLDINSLANALLLLCRHNILRIDGITEDTFYSNCELTKDISDALGVSYSDIKETAADILHKEHGMGYPTDIKLDKPGKYLIVGDSRGKQTKTVTFDMLKTLNKELGFEKIIHIGHILDDDNDISYYWQDFDNLIILSKEEELNTIVGYMEQTGSSFDIVRDKLNVGNLLVRNQDLMTNEYIKGGIQLLDQKLFQQDMIVNSHKHEMDSKTTADGSLLYMSPGCLCERHVVKTIRGIDWINNPGGPKTNIAYSNSFATYRRKNELKELWESGLYIIDVDEDGGYTPHASRICDMDDEHGKGCVYFDTIYTSNGVCEPDTKVFVTADGHIPMHDPRLFNLFNDVVDDFAPDVYVNLGDMASMEALNHHAMGRGNISEYMNTDLLDEMAEVNYVMTRMKTWADDCYLLFANHERFMTDFIKKFPQLGSLINLSTLVNMDELGFNLVPHKELLNIDNAKYSHGDLRAYGLSGKIHDKFARLYNTAESPAMLGHIHYPAIRSGVYSIGLSGKLDQGYNEPTASRWMHGYGLTLIHGDNVWNTTTPVVDYTVNVNGQQYHSANGDGWTLPEYQVDVTYKFDIK